MRQKMALRGGGSENNGTNKLVLAWQHQAIQQLLCYVDASLLLRCNVHEYRDKFHPTLNGSA
jgi:hypothetical protein